MHIQPISNNFSGRNFLPANQYNPKPKTQINFTSYEDTFDYDAQLKKNLDARNVLQKLFGLGKQKAKELTNIELLLHNINKSNNSPKKRQETEWNNIAGYERVKERLENIFIGKLNLEKIGYNANIPNGILLYGQHGTGKTEFAKAFAQKTGCEFVSINTIQDDNIILKDLKNELKKAKKRYNSKETPNKRTIILLDDINFSTLLTEKDKKDLTTGLITLKETAAGKFADLLDDCANKYKATIIMTSSHPRKFDTGLLRADLIPYQIFLGPPNQTDAAKIFQYHAKDYAQKDIDYDKLGNELTKAINNNEAYSAKGIVNIVENAKNKNNNSQITEDDLIESIKEIKPDITQADFKEFEADMNELLDEYDV